MKKIRKILFFAVLCLIAQMPGMAYLEPLPVSADEPSGLVEKVGSAEIRWSEGTIRATGVGRPPGELENPADAAFLAERAAIVVARRNLLLTAKGVRVEGSRVVGDFMTSTGRFRMVVTGLVEGSRPIKTELLPDGSVRATVEMPLRGALVESLIQELIPPGKQGVEGPKRGWLHRAGQVMAHALQWFRISLAWAIGEKTGLVIDATGSGAKPALFPRITDKEGKQVYGVGIFDPKHAAAKGAVGYAPGLEAALSATDRIGYRPLVAKAAIPTGSSGGVDLKLVDSDKASLEAALKEPVETLKKCGVVIAYKWVF